MGSLDELCEKAISINLMTSAQKAGIFAAGNKYIHASNFLEHFEMMIAVQPPVLFDFMNMLSELQLVPCAAVIQQMGRCWC